MFELGGHRLEFCRGLDQILSLSHACDMLIISFLHLFHGAILPSFLSLKQACGPFPSQSHAS